MPSWASWTAKTALVAVGFAAAGGGLSSVAWAGTVGSSPGAVALLGGNGPLAPVSLPIAVCGNAGALLGIAAAGCQGGALASVGASLSAGGSGTSRSVSIGSGNQVTIPVSVPGHVCGDAAAVLGAASAGCVGGASAATNSGAAAGGDPSGRPAGTVPPSAATPGPAQSRAPRRGTTVRPDAVVRPDVPVRRDGQQRPDGHRARRPDVQRHPRRAWPGREHHRYTLRVAAGRSWRPARPGRPAVSGRAGRPARPQRRDRRQHPHARQRTERR